MQYGYEQGHGLFSFNAKSQCFRFHGKVETNQLPPEFGLMGHGIIQCDDNGCTRMEPQQVAWNGAAFLAAPSTAFVNVWFDGEGNPHAALSERSSESDGFFYSHVRLRHPNQISAPDGSVQFLISGMYEDSPEFQRMVEKWSCSIFSTPSLRDNLVAFGACVSSFRVQDRIRPRIVYFVEPVYSDLPPSIQPVTICDPDLIGDFTGRMAAWVCRNRIVVNCMASQVDFNVFYQRVLSLKPSGDDFVVLVSSAAAETCLGHLKPALRKLALHWPTRVPTAKGFFDDREFVQTYVVSGASERGLIDFMTFCNAFGNQVVISSPLKGYNGKTVFFSDKAYDGEEVVKYVGPEDTLRKVQH